MAWRRSVGDAFESRYGNLEGRFWAKVDQRGPDDCWPWLGTIERSGYGQFFTGSTPRLVKAHRFAYELMVGPIPEGLDLDHTCHDPAVCALRSGCPHRRCVNSAHLEPVTEQVNVLRSGAIPAVEAQQTHCIHGHPFTGDNLIIRRDGSRKCRTCKNESARRSYRRRSAN